MSAASYTQLSFIPETFGGGTLVVSKNGLEMMDSGQFVADIKKQWESKEEPTLPSP